MLLRAQVATERKAFLCLSSLTLISFPLAFLKWSECCFAVDSWDVLDVSVFFCAISYHWNKLAVTTGGYCVSPVNELKQGMNGKTLVLIFPSRCVLAYTETHVLGRHFNGLLSLKPKFSVSQR